MRWTQISGQLETKISYGAGNSCEIVNYWGAVNREIGLDSNLEENGSEKGSSEKGSKRGQEEICSIARFSRSQSTEEKVFSGRVEQDRTRL